MACPPRRFDGFDFTPNNSGKKIPSGHARSRPDSAHWGIEASQRDADPIGLQVVLPTVLQQIGQFAEDDGDVALLFKTHPYHNDRPGKLEVAIGDSFDTVKGQTLERRLYWIKP